MSDKCKAKRMSMRRYAVELSLRLEIIHVAAV